MRDMRLNRVVLFWGVLLAVVILSSSLMADERSEEALKADSWSFQFAINDNFDFNSFEGTNLSCKKHLSDTKAWRLGVGLSATSRNNSETTNNQNQSGSEDANSQSGLYVDLSLLLLHYKSPKSRVAFFYGIGPEVGLSRNKSESEPVYPPANISHSYYSWSIGGGIRGILGVEWFATKDISLFAEYGTSLEYLYSYTEQESKYNDSFNISKEIDRMFILKANQVTLGVSVYFL